MSAAGSRREVLVTVGRPNAPEGAEPAEGAHPVELAGVAEGAEPVELAEGAELAGKGAGDVSGEIEHKISLLEERLAGLGSVVVAFSGGVDSALLAWTANRVLGDRALAATAVSVSLAPAERRWCESLAAEWGMQWREVFTREMDDPLYLANGTDRCYHCKSALMDALEPLAAPGGARIALGVNVDDLGEFRPGQEAARERGAVFPLVDAGMTKAEIRLAARMAGLSVWDKPAMPCLASRISHDLRVDGAKLDAVGRAEAALAGMGFREVRVRHHGDIARLEFPVADLARALELREGLVGAVQEAGFRYVTLDLEGLRSGNLAVTAIGRAIQGRRLQAER